MKSYTLNYMNYSNNTYTTYGSNQIPYASLTYPIYDQYMNCFYFHEVQGIGNLTMTFNTAGAVTIVWGNATITSDDATNLVYLAKNGTTIETAAVGDVQKLNTIDVVANDTLTIWEYETAILLFQMMFTPNSESV